MTAASDGNCRLVTGLLIAGADINSRNDRGETLLDLGVKCGQRDVVQTLLGHNLSGYSCWEECLRQCDENKERNEKLVAAAESGDNDSECHQSTAGGRRNHQQRHGRVHWTTSQC